MTHGRPACDGYLAGIIAGRISQGGLDPWAVRFLHGGNVDNHLSAQATQSELAGQFRGGGDIGLQPARPGSVGTGINVDSDQSASRLNNHAGGAERELGTAQVNQQIEDSGLLQLVPRHGAIPVTHRNGVGAGAVEDLTLALCSRRGPVRLLGEHGNLIGNLLAIRIGRSRPQDQTKGRVGSCLGKRSQLGPPSRIRNPAGQVHPRRTGRDNGQAPFELQLGPNRNSLTLFGVSRDLHGEAMPRVQSVGPAQISCQARPEVQHRAALTCHRPIDDRPEDGTGPGTVRGVEQKVLEPPVHQKRRGLHPANAVENHLTPPQAGLQTGYPQEDNRAAVSARGKPTIPVNDPEIHGISAPAGPWMP